MLNLTVISGLLTLLALVAGLVMLGFTAGYCARSHGRSFWLWTVLGVVLPIISYCVLFVLILHDEVRQGQRLLREAQAILAAAEQAEHL
ncbi:hypothetical protein [Hymenobacter pini]|uniref:hypothetical protein n=1 Tax=Hymenobacter pini TaxID=2880879 RepID=UPI001CF4B7E5|nr:hypothetical protein [Hymenobacter pini]MCA8829958.1 hypothetical protein [Hymenobacter pini]